jgi:maltose-binding protein MalE
VVEVEKPVVVEKEVVKEVPVEKVVEKEVQVVVTAAPAQPAGGDPVIRWQHDGRGVYQDAAAKGAARFNEAHGDITLLIEPLPPNALEKLMAAIVAGVAPDIWEWWGLWCAKVHQKGQAMDMQPFVDAAMTEEDTADFVPNEWDNIARPRFLRTSAWRCPGTSTSRGSTTTGRPSTRQG